MIQSIAKFCALRNKKGMVIVMDDIYIVITNSEVDSAYRSVDAANNRIVELCRFSFEDVLYDELCHAYSETSSIKICQLI
jgi:hypothetical protein